MSNTNKKLSRELAEVGFEAPSNQFWSGDVLEYHSNEEQENADSAAGLIPSFDFETLFDALPAHYRPKNDGGELYLYMNKYGVSYVCVSGEDHEESLSISFTSKESEKADVLAALLIRVIKTGYYKQPE